MRGQKDTFQHIPKGKKQAFLYEREPLAEGAYKQRRIGCQQWIYFCRHALRRDRCRECGGSSIFALSAPPKCGGAARAAGGNRTTHAGAAAATDGRRQARARAVR